MKKLWTVQRDLPPTRGISTTHLWAEDEEAVKAAILPPYRFRACRLAPLPRNGIEAAELERDRQMEAEGYNEAHDDGHACGELALAGACYASHAAAQSEIDGLAASYFQNLGQYPEEWPWRDGSWKPSDSPKRNLEKAMALLAAEWDRLDRLEKAEGGGGAAE